MSPITTPVSFETSGERHFIVGRDSTLILSTYDATTAEVAEIVLRINLHEQLQDALRRAITSLRDLSNHWPQSELHEPVKVTIERATKLVPDLAADLQPTPISET